MKKKILVAAGALLIVVGGAGAAMLATQSTVTATITVPYTIGDQTGQVVVSKDIDVPTVTETVTVTSSTTPPSTTSPDPASTLSVDGSWTCNKAVNYNLVRVTNHGSGDAVRLASGCTGRIGRLEVTGVVNGDAVKIQNADSNAAHDLVIESGYASCAGPSTDGTHQDGVQGMGGSNITFQNFVFDCYGGGGGNFFIQRAGSGATNPTNIVCDGCALGPREPNNVNLGTSIGAGVRNSLICRPLSGRNPFQTDSGAQQIVNENNTVVTSSDPRCASVDSLSAATG